MALKDLSAQPDAAQFAQVHRSVVVNLSSVDRVVRGANETADIHLKGRRRKRARNSEHAVGRRSSLPRGDRAASL